MPLFLLRLDKAINVGGVSYKWSNRYFSEDAGYAGALQRAINYWVLGERLFHGALAHCYQVYANNTADPPNSPGQLAGVPNELQRGAVIEGAADVLNILPSWNVVRVDFPVVNSRPNRKFYRLPLREGDITNGLLDADVLTRMSPGCNTLATSSGHRDSQGNLLTGTFIIRGITSKRLGKFAGVSVPVGPPFG